MKKIQVFLLLYLCICYSYGSLTCNIEKPCYQSQEIECELTERPFSLTDHSAGTIVADPRCQKVHVTSLSNQQTHITIEWNAPRSLYLRGFLIQIGDRLETLTFRRYYMVFPELSSDKCLISKIQNVTFELHCEYTGHSTRLDVILNSMPIYGENVASLDKFITIDISRKGKPRQESYYLNSSWQSDYEKAIMFKPEYEKECQTETQEKTGPQLLYTIVLICSAFIIVIIITAAILLRNTQGDNECTFLRGGKENDGGQCAVNVDQEPLNNEVYAHRDCFSHVHNSRGHALLDGSSMKESLGSSLLNLSSSQCSIATQEIERCMLEINFGSPYNNLNK
ncbi:uncharacterized protein LOC125671395 [Ostrea edulis]|uniref:uncharacterized protein LOC125671395 n=1 Tax=Ostrea edulis TaxID=37623 RepID=UPI0024AFE10A|nr:uncharacterized protein LOC125671395 [Ostrea edulis]